MSWTRIGFVAHVGLADLQARVAELLFGLARWLDPFNAMSCGSCGRGDGLEADETDQLTEMEMRSAYVSTCFVEGADCDGGCGRLEFAINPDAKQPLAYVVRVMSPTGERQ